MSKSVTPQLQLVELPPPALLPAPADHPPIQDSRARAVYELMSGHMLTYDPTHQEIPE